MHEPDKDLLHRLQHAGRELREVRVQMGLSLKQFCEKYGLDEATYSVIERGLVETAASDTVTAPFTE